MEEIGDKYIQTMDSFLKTMNTRVNRSRGKAPKNLTNKNICQFFTVTQLTNICGHVLKLVKMFVYQKRIFRSEKVTKNFNCWKTQRTWYNIYKAQSFSSE